MRRRSEIIPVEQNLSEAGVLRIFQQSPANVLKGVADVLEVSGVASTVQERRKTADRLEVPLKSHQIKDSLELGTVKLLGVLRLPLVDVVVD